MYSLIVGLGTMPPPSVNAFNESICSPAQVTTNIPTESSQSYPNRAIHPDFNLDIRGFVKSSHATRSTIRPHPEEYVDPHVPDLTTILDHPLVIKDVYRVFDWNWTANKKGDLLPDSTLVSVSTLPNEPIHAPSIGYTLGGVYKYLVIYADTNQVVINSTRNGDVTSGYTLHLKNLQVDNQLLTSYHQLESTGGKQLPAITAATVLGCASSQPLLLAIRDTGTFMPVTDPNDWGFNPIFLSPLNRP